MKKVLKRLVEFLKKDSDFTAGLLSVFLIFVLAYFAQFIIDWRIDKKSNPAPAKKVQTAQTQKNPPKIIQFELKIPKLGINVPVIPNVDGSNQKSYDKALEGGVAHFAGTGLPGEGNNIFIFGHSSYYLNQPGHYKTIFRNLNNLQKGDQIEIILNAKRYYYLVNSKKIVLPSAAQYLQPTSTEQLTLSTCWPPDTTKKRLIVIAKPK